MRNIPSSFLIRVAPRSAFGALIAIAGSAGFLAVNACGSSSSSSTPSGDAGFDVNAIQGGNTDSGGDANVSDASGGVTVSPATLTIYPGGSGTITVNRGSAQGDLALSIGSLPTGVTATTGTIASGQSSAQLTLTADGTVVAPQKIPSVQVTINGASGPVFELDIIGAPGTLDISWGTGGIARGAGANSTQATGVGFQKSGAVVIGGFSGQTYAVARYTTSGVLDTTFGTGGITTVTPTGQNSFSNTGGISVDSTDRIALVGASSDTTNGNQGRIARFTATGALDTTFNSTGFALTGTADTLFGITAAQTDFVACGFNTTSLTGVLREVDSTGALVAGFAGNTSAIFQPPAPNNALDVRVLGVALQSSGKIVACGDQGSTCARFTSAGAVDSTFGTSGFNVTAGTKHTFAAIAVNTDDSIIAVGSDGSAPQQFFVEKFTKDGAVDTTFGAAASGFVATHFGDSGQDSYANGVAIQSDGKIVVVGEATASGRSVMTVARYTSAGAIDPSFGASGVLLEPVATSTAMANAVAIQPDGRIVVAGHGDMDFAVLRVWP